GILNEKNRSDNSLTLSQKYIPSCTPVIRVTAPTSGQNINVGSNATVSWNVESVSGDLEMRLSTDGGNSFPTVLANSVTASARTQVIQIPNVPTTQAVIRLASLSNRSIQGSSTQFRISLPAPNFAVTLLAPTTAAPPLIGQEIKVNMTMKNNGTQPLAKLAWRIQKENGPVFGSGEETGIPPGGTRTVSATFNAPTLPGSLRIIGSADPQNELNEPLSQQNDNQKPLNLSIALPKPLVIPGRVTYRPPAFSVEYTVCNVDPEASYTPRLQECSRED